MPGMFFLLLNASILWGVIAGLLTWLLRFKSLALVLLLALLVIGSTFRHIAGMPELIGFYGTSLQIDTHSDDEAGSFERAIKTLPEVVSCHSVGGGADFFLQVVCKDLDDYADFSMTRLRRLPGIKAMTSNFALKEIKPDNGWPLSELA